MTVLVMVLGPNKSDVVNALRMKSSLWDKGIVLSGMVIRNKNSETIPSGFLEDMMQLKIIGSIRDN
jgi:hypothetical protein